MGSNFTFVNKSLYCKFYLICFIFPIMLVTVGCGSQTNENSTYFSSRGPNGSPPVINEACVATVCKCDLSICQLRLDFMTFELAGTQICHYHDQL
jgi:hypothetical protein